MRYILLLLVISSIHCSAQTNERLDSLQNSMTIAGKHLEAYARESNIALTLYISGNALLAIGAVTDIIKASNNVSNSSTSSTNSFRGHDIFYIAGGLLSLVGIVSHMSASSDIGRAGLILQGSGIAIPIKGKKR